MADEDRCPECQSEDLQIESSRDRNLPDRGTGPPAAARPVARSFWLRCENCGNLRFAIRSLMS